MWHTKLIQTPTAQASKIILIQPAFNDNPRAYTFPRGLMQLAATLKDKEFLLEYFQQPNAPMFLSLETVAATQLEIELINLQTEPKDFDLAEHLRQAQPQVIGVSATTPLFPAAKQIASIAQAAVPQALRVLGGVHVSATPLESMQTTDFQVGVRGEGEEIFAELVFKHLYQQDLSTTPGTIYKNANGELLLNPEHLRLLPKREQTPAYKALPFFHNPQFRKQWLLFTSAGCYGTCSFCGSHLVFGRKIHNVQTAQEIFNEIKLVHDKFKIRSFAVGDDIFTSNKRRLLALANLLEQSKLKVHFLVQSRADMITDELCLILKRLNCDILAIGVESGDQEILDRVIDKKIDLNAVRKARKILQAHGLKTKFYMMAGLPDQGWQSIRRSVEFILETKPDVLDAFRAIPYPGTSLANNPALRLISEKKEYLDYYINSEHTTTETNVMSSNDIALAIELLHKAYVYAHTPEKHAELLATIPNN